MKNSNRLITLTLSLAAPALSAWFLAGREFSADLLFGAYTLAGLFFLTAADYAPRRILTGSKPSAKSHHRWIRTSLSRSRHASATSAQQAEKILA